MAEMIKTEKGFISESSPWRVVVEDNIEGDVTLNFRLMSDDKEHTCYTRFNTLSSHEADICIYNAENKTSIRPQARILVGTYLGLYNLYLNYTLCEAGEGALRSISVTFYKQLKEN